MNLREAAEMALEVLTNYVEDPRCQKEIDKAAEALRQALAQPEHKWVGLTEEDRSEIRRSGSYSIRDKDFQAIEDRLKEKNV